MSDDWFERFAHLFKENGYNRAPTEIYQAFLSVIDRPGKILELGCGNGLLLRFLCDHSSYHLEPFGVDISPQKIKRAQVEIFPDRPEAFQTADIRSHALRQGPFSLIITNPIYADRGYYEQVGGKIAKLYADGAISQYVIKCKRNLSFNGRLILFCYQEQLRDIQSYRSEFERELKAVGFQEKSAGLQMIAFFSCRKGCVAMTHRFFLCSASGALLNKEMMFIEHCLAVAESCILRSAH